VLLPQLPLSLHAKEVRWRTKSRLQASYEYDSNIRENPSDSLKNISDSSFRLLFQWRATRATPKNKLKFEYQGGLQSYFSNKIENKLINELKASAVSKLGKFAAGVRLNGRLKIYLNDVLDYSRGEAELFLQLPRVLRLSPTLRIGASQMHYQHFSAFDYSEKYLTWSVRKNLSTRTSATVNLTGNIVDYDRVALFFEPEGPTLIFNAAQQRDRQLNLKVQLNYTKRFLLNVRYAFQYNDSNSFGSTYSRHQLTLILGVPLPRQVWLRAYVALQLKNYSQANIPIFPLDADPERQESNFVIVDISKDLSPSTSLLLRLATYSNESVIRNRFYKKTLLTLGFDFRF